MSTKVFINLPVKDLGKSKAFYTGLGYSINPHFTDDKAACIVISEHVFVMTLTEPFFATFTKKSVADATKTAQVINALSADSRDEVDDIMKMALASGGSQSMPAMDHGFMYSQSFHDPDGHIWEVMWMDEAALQQS